MLLGLAQTLRELAAGVDAFGRLVRNEAGPLTGLGSDDVEALRDALDGMQEARARLSDLATTKSPPEVRELHAIVLATVKRLLREMDIEQRVRGQIQLFRPARPRATYLGRPTSKRPSTARETTPDAETQPLPRQSDDPHP